MNLEGLFITLFTVGILLEFALDNALEFADFKFRRKHGREIPPELEGLVDAQRLGRTCEYEDAKYKLWLPRTALSCVLNLSLVFGGFYPWLFNKFWEIDQNPYLTMLAFGLLHGIPEAAMNLPFKLYREFGLEKRFGFSKMTARIFIQDFFKSLAVSLLIGIPVLLLAIFIVTNVRLWWLYLSIVMTAISLGLAYVYPAFIAPIFNKFSPVEDEELKIRIQELLQRTGFKASGIFVMDASKRSGHSNAYFTGFGRNKRIVLYDTLLKQLDADEIVAVLAHELGHFKLRHIQKKLAGAIALTFALAFASSVIITIPELYTDFGLLNAMSDGRVMPEFYLMGMLFLGMAKGGYEILLSPIFNGLSRRDEFQADSFAARLCASGRPLSSALIKLNSENLSEISCPKIYSIFNDSHPPLLERIRAVM